MGIYIFFRRLRIKVSNCLELLPNFCALIVVLSISVSNVCMAQASATGQIGPQAQSISPASSVISMDQILKTEEHTVTALEIMYGVATGIAAFVILAIGIIGFKSLSDFSAKLSKAQSDFEKIKSDGEMEVEKVRAELLRAVDQRNKLQGEHDQRILILEKQSNMLNQKIIIATNLSEVVEKIEREFPEFIKSLNSGQSVQQTRDSLVSKLQEARKLSLDLDHKRLQSWVEATLGRLHLLLHSWEDARIALLKAEELDKERNVKSPARAFNLACLYGAWYKENIENPAHHDVDGIAWCRETVRRAVGSPLPTKGRGHWFNLLKTDDDLDALRNLRPGEFQEMYKELNS